VIGDVGPQSSIVTMISFAEYIFSRIRPDGPGISKVLTVAMLETKFPFRRTIPVARRAQRLWRSFTVEGYSAQKVPPITQLRSPRFGQIF
jgi:hypothetical protein